MMVVLAYSGTSPSRKEKDDIPPMSDITPDEMGTTSAPNEEKGNGNAPGTKKRRQTGATRLVVACRAGGHPAGAMWAPQGVAKDRLGQGARSLAQVVHQWGEPAGLAAILAATLGVTSFIRGVSQSLPLSL
jgi:hypothetical protein